MSNLTKQEGKKTHINVRTSKTAKSDFDKICRKYGTTISTVINIFVHQVIKSDKIPGIAEKLEEW